MIDMNIYIPPTIASLLCVVPIYIVIIFHYVRVSRKLAYTNKLEISNQVLRSDMNIKINNIQDALTRIEIKLDKKERDNDNADK